MKHILALVLSFSLLLPVFAQEKKVPVQTEFFGLKFGTDRAHVTGTLDSLGVAYDVTDGQIFAKDMNLGNVYWTIATFAFIKSTFTRLWLFKQTRSDSETASIMNLVCSALKQKYPDITEHDKETLTYIDSDWNSVTFGGRDRMITLWYSWGDGTKVFQEAMNDF